MRKLLILILLGATSAFADNVLVTNDGNHPVPVEGSNVTVNTTVDLSSIIGNPGATPSPSPARAMVVQGIAGATPVLVNGGVTVAGAAVAPNYYAAHITTKTTTTPTSSTAYISQIVISCSNAGTSETMVIQTKEGTPKIIVPSFTLAVPTTGTPIVISFARPILATSGIDIITGGSTAGVVDVWITYFQ